MLKSYFCAGTGEMHNCREHPDEEEKSPKELRFCVKRPPQGVDFHL
jgi:hypothetical protein